MIYSGRESLTKGFASSAMLERHRQYRARSSRKLAGTILLPVALLVLVVLARTLSYGRQPPQPTGPLPPAPGISAPATARHLSEALRFETVSLPPVDGIRQYAEQPWLDFHTWLEMAYPRVHDTLTKETVAGLTLIYRWEGSNTDLKPLVFLAHQDVVPVDGRTRDDWLTPPFGGEQKDGYIYGRGVLDNKGSLVALMEALEALLHTGFQPERTIFLVLGHDEEIGGSGAKAAFEVLKDRGVRAAMVLDEGLLVLDPSPLTGKRAAMIGIAEKGYLTLQITARSVGGHSSAPTRDSAAVRLGQALVALDQNQMPINIDTPPVSDLLETSAADMPFLTRMALANSFLLEPLIDRKFSAKGPSNAVVRTTMAPTMLAGSPKENILPQRASALVNFRIHPADTEEGILRHVREVTGHIRDLDISVAPGSLRVPASPISSTETRGYEVLSAVAHHISGGAQVSPGLITVTTDAKWARMISDNVYNFWPIVLAPEELKGIHGTNERLSIANLQLMTESYAQIVMMMGQ